MNVRAGRRRKLRRRGFFCGIGDIWARTIHLKVLRIDGDGQTACGLGRKSARATQYYIDHRDGGAYPTRMRAFHGKNFTCRSCAATRYGRSGL